MHMNTAHRFELKVLHLAVCAAMAHGAAAAQAQEAGPVAQVIVTGQAPGTALTVADTAQATAAIERIPGAVAIVPDEVFKNGPAQTIKDVLGRVPGVVTQTRWGPDARVSIRGSGLSRSYGNRGINMYMDGIPINTSDGLFDLFEIDPTAYRYVEVFKGANAMRYGANSLGGAVNFVTPSGRDADRFEARLDGGSFGYGKAQVSSGGIKGAYDYFVTASAERWDGYREHSKGHQQRLSGNLGYRISPDAETRLYVNVNSWRSRLPGEVSKQDALATPRAADPYFELVDQQRNIDSQRLASKTTLRFGPTVLDIGLFGVRRHVMHPIFQWLDFRVRDHGGFVRVSDERSIGDRTNRLVAGINLHNGSIDNNQYRNLPGAVKGALAASNVDKSKNVSAYVDNALFVRPDLALVTGIQYLHATRARSDRFLSNGDQSGRNSFDIASPKVGLLWDVDPAWQVFANISRSAEVPTFDVNTFGAPASSTVNAQTATTYEIGTRGRRESLTWDLSLYHANIRKELQCLGNPAALGACTVTNADRTVHRGIEAGIGMDLGKSIFADGDTVALHGTYTYNGFRFDDDAVYGDNRLPGVAPHALHAELLYKRPDGLYAGPNIEWMPRAFYADNANRLAVDAYRLVNLRLGYEREGAGWSGYLEARNVFDKRYISSSIVVETADANSPLFNPGTGRSLHAGLRYAW
jgi:iron complex outermembrane receptor protein